METINLQITRKKSFVGCAMSYKILIDGVEKCRLRNGETTTLTIPKQQCVLGMSMVGNSLNFHKISREIVLFPSNSKTGTSKCEIVTSPKWTGIFTCGLFAPVGTVDLRITY